MFKAINRQSDEAIIILDPKWKNQVDYLRSLDRRNTLICQGCKQPVRLRAGEIRCWHFAHKHLQNCPYGHASPILLKAREILYKWLVSKFGDMVTVEKELGNDHFPRPVDCWIEGESGGVAYWIIESGMKPPKRENLKWGFEQAEVRVNWVFVADMLHEDEDDSNRVHLTTTEREFLQRSDYDEIVRDSRFSEGSLHYLDPDNEVLTTFRGLRLIHKPQLYEGHREEHELSLVLAAPKTGVKCRS
jgi:competence CoiA-like predicted nuclease